MFHVFLVEHPEMWLKSCQTEPNSQKLVPKDEAGLQQLLDAHPALRQAVSSSVWMEEDGICADYVRD